MLLGDLNLDRLQPAMAEGKLLIDLEEIQGLECLINKPTRIQKSGTHMSKTLIDVILTNRLELFAHSGDVDPGLSDHALVYALLHVKVARFGSKVVRFRSTKNYNEQKFKEHLSVAPWHVGEILDDIDDQAGFLSTLLTEIVNEHMPLKQMRVRDKDVPYMTTEWKESIQARRKAAKHYQDWNY